MKSNLYLHAVVTSNCDGAETRKPLAKIRVVLADYNVFKATAETLKLSHYFFDSPSYKPGNDVTLVSGMNALFIRCRGEWNSGRGLAYDEFRSAIKAQGGLLDRDALEYLELDLTEKTTITDILADEGWAENGSNIGRAFEMLIKKAHGDKPTVAGSNEFDLVLSDGTTVEIKTNGGTEKED